MDTLSARTSDRISGATAPEINLEIRAETDARVAELAHAGDDAINRRLYELDREWDIERALLANAGAAVLTSIFLGSTVSRAFFVLPGVIGSFLLVHAVQGWCPPLPILRRMGVRTAREIEHERNALKAIRGDFASIAAGGSQSTNGYMALEAARR